MKNFKENVRLRRSWMREKAIKFRYNCKSGSMYSKNVEKRRNLGNYVENKMCLYCFILHSKSENIGRYIVEKFYTAFIGVLVRGCIIKSNAETGIACMRKGG